MQDEVEFIAGGIQNNVNTWILLEHLWTKEKIANMNSYTNSYAYVPDEYTRDHILRKFRDLGIDKLF